MLIEQVINLRLKTGYLKLRTDVRERVINGWPKFWVADCSKFFGLKIKPIQSRQISAWLSNIIFSLVTVFAANVGCNWFRIITQIISKLLHAALHRVWLVNMQIVPKPYFLIRDQWHGIESPWVSNKFSKFHFSWICFAVTTWNLQCIENFLTLTRSQYCKSNCQMTCRSLNLHLK